MEVFKSQKINLLRNLGVCIGVVSAFNFTIAYIPFVSQNAFSLNTGQVLLLTTFFMSISILFLLICGKMADCFGKRLLMSLGCIGCCVFVPFVLYYTEVGNLAALFALQSITCFFLCCLIAPLNAFCGLDLFPTETRFSANGFVWGIGSAIFGGLTPFICQLLQDWTGSFWGPSSYVIACQCGALLAIYKAPSN